jgi:hypothetical protein
MDSFGGDSSSVGGTGFLKGKCKIKNPEEIPIDIIPRGERL